MGVGGKSITTSNTPCESVTSSYLFEPIFSYSTISSFLQAVCLLHLSSEMESRAASLRIEALQCLTICLAGTDTKGFWDLLVTYFGAESDKDEVLGIYRSQESCGPPPGPRKYGWGRARKRGIRSQMEPRPPHPLQT